MKEQKNFNQAYIPTIEEMQSWYRDDLPKEASKLVKYEDNKKIEKQIKIVFEITDGASSFPGSAKEVVQELLFKNVETYAFQIGENSKANEKIFNFVWNEGYKQPHGVMIGEQVEKLPRELLKAVGENMQSIFT